MSALPPTSGLTLLSQWSVNPIALAVGVAVAVWYFAMTRRLRAAGDDWSTRRSALFYVGIAGYLYCTNGFPNAYATTLLWTWSTEVLSLLLLVPVLLMAGQPIELASRTAGHDSVLERMSQSRPSRFLTHPFVSTAFVPLLTAVLFFGHVADLWTTSPWVAGLLGLGLVATGCLVARQLTFEDFTLSSLTIGVMLAVSVLELLTDAIPGIVLRFSTHLVTTHFAVHRTQWAMSPMTDQKLAGSILWGVAEMLDLPFMFIIFLRWTRADEREGQRADQQADLLATTRRPREPGADSDDESGTSEPGTDAPWWLADPQLASRPGLAPDRRAGP
jgi:cytochrome c oxidase assembly factor CtaG